MQQLGGVVAATRGCGSSQKGCGIRETLSKKTELIGAEGQTYTEGLDKRLDASTKLTLVSVP